MSAADRDGNGVVIHSNSFPRFGSGDLLSNGLVLNNRPGRGSDLQALPDAPNAPAADPRARLRPPVTPPTTSPVEPWN